MANRNDNDAAISVLNDLIETSKDGVNGFRAAADAVESAEAKAVFLSRVQYIERAVVELQDAVRRLGGDPEDSGSFMGKTHQRFLDLKAAITGRDDKAIINEVERGEDYLKEKFETALSSGDLSSETRAVVERAYQSVRSGHDQISRLKHGMEA